MTADEVKKIITDLPLGSRLELIKTNGHVIQVTLMSHEVEGVAEKDYGNIVIPELPPAIIVTGGPRFGNYRIDTADIVNIARIG